MATLQRRLWDHGSVRFGVAVLAFMVLPFIELINGLAALKMISAQ